MTRFGLILILCFSIGLLDNSIGQNRFPKVSIKNTELRKIKSNYVNQTFSIDIFLPEDYYKSTDTLPVVYVTDAEYNFGMVSYVTDRLIKGKEITKVILVGVAYDTTYEAQYNFRRRDYTPTRVDSLGVSGGADNFICFIKNELMPFIKKEYRTVPNDNSIVGLSYGGLLAYYSLFKYPDLFKRYLIVSPSIWYDHLCLYGYEEQFYKNSKEQSAIIYTSVGGNENLNGDLMLAQWKEFTNKIVLRNYQNFRLKAEVLEGETHKSIFSRAYTNGIKFICKDSLKN